MGKENLEDSILKNKRTSNLESIKEKIYNINPAYIKLCSDFLILYSRLEYSLKECGFLQTSSRAMASIENYADSLTEKFKPEPESELENAVNYLIQHPPNIQLKDGNNLVWMDQVLEGTEIQILPEYLRRVRNNLLHGGKFYDGIETGERNWQLIKYSMVIIENLIDSNEDVKLKFGKF